VAAPAHEGGAVADPARTIGIAIQLADPSAATACLVLSAQISDVSVVGPSGLLLRSSFTDGAFAAAANPAASSPLTPGRPSS
jgi:hypothetical protein